MPRLQFSLRTLLILMAVVSAGIVVYRWPWAETTINGPEQVTTQFHRGWNGKAVKHGVQRRTFENSQIVREDWYEEDELRRQRLVQGDLVYNEQSFRAGQLDGPYLDFGSRSTTKGNYRAGKKHGKWQIGGFEPIVAEEWRDGKRHGLRTWTTPEGRVLQTAEYDDGRLIGWNGKLVEEELSNLLVANVTDDELRRNLFVPVSASRSPLMSGRFGSRFLETIYFVGDAQWPLTVHWVDGDWTLDFSIRDRDRPSGEAILQAALEQSHTLAIRYNRLHVVPINSRQLDWQDQTGVNEIQFEPDSLEAQYWLNPAKADSALWNLPTLQLKQLCERDGRTLIEVDTSAIDDAAVELFPEPKESPYFSMPHTRRDLIGQTLDAAGYRCELRGKTLVIKPQADR